eukprot:6134351-Prymnesium_polylepis.1
MTLLYTMCTNYSRNEPSIVSLWLFTPAPWRRGGAGANRNPVLYFTPVPGRTPPFEGFAKASVR